MKKATLFFLSLILLLFAPQIAKAETVLSVSGNSDSSQNQVNISVQNTTAITQSNNADVNNQANSNADTGNNQANSNTGDTNITTGNIQTQTNVENQNINSNTFDDKACGCSCGNGCPSSDAVISGNGTESNNLIDVNNQSAKEIMQTNNATITNNVEVHASTGNNSANNNNGDVKIETGNIIDKINIENKNINQNTDPQGNNESQILYKISGNGAGSINTILVVCANDFNYVSINNATLVNNVIDDPNTGNNTANNNNGDVYITTGDIYSTINIENEDINTSEFCCGGGPIVPPPPPVTPPTPPVTPPTPGGGNNGVSSSSSSGGVGGGSVLGASTEALPVTGGYWLYLFTLISTITFFTGLYLRLHSGCSPGIIFS